MPYRHFISVFDYIDKDTGRKRTIRAGWAGEVSPWVAKIADAARVTSDNTTSPEEAVAHKTGRK